MKKTLYILAIVIVTLATISSCRIETAKDYVEQKTRVVNVQPFNAIFNNTYADVHFTPSDKYEVKITGSEKLISRISVKVSNGSLIISGDDKDEVDYIYSGKHAGIAEVWVKAPTLEAINSVGSGDFTAEGAITTQKLSVSSAGAGDIILNGINCKDSLDITTLGAGDVSLGKQAKALIADFNTSGSGNLSAGDITSQEVTVMSLGSGDFSSNISDAAKINVSSGGSGDIELNVKNCGDISGNSNGSGDISVRGSAKSCNIDSNGSGDVDKDIKGN